LEWQEAGKALKSLVKSQNKTRKFSSKKIYKKYFSKILTGKQNKRRSESKIKN